MIILKRNSQSGSIFGHQVDQFSIDKNKDAVRLIVPDKQLIGIGHPHIVTPVLRGRLFFFDEANVSWCPQTGRIYRVKGTQYKVNTPGQNKTWYILGSLEYPTGEGLYEIYDHKTNLQVRSNWQSLL